MNPVPIRTPDQRLRVFISSTLGELAPERAAVREAVESLHLAPVMFELGARPHPPRSLYRSYLRQSDIFVGIYWQRYGWIAPGEEVSGLEDEYLLAGGMPALLYVKAPAPEREGRLASLLERVRADDRASYKSFSDADELARLVSHDLSTLLADRFAASIPRPPAGDGIRGRAVPTAYTPTIGRTREHEEIAALLQRPEVRLVTLLGPGGIGKSRLAIEVASARATAGAEVAFVLLETVPAAEHVLGAIATDLGLRETAGPALRGAVVEALRDREMLLVIDNMEHVLAASDVLVDLLTEVPDLTVLTTSRVPLRVRAERTYEVAPLPVPDEDAAVSALTRSPAVALFEERARAALPGFTVTARNAAAVAGICRATEGVPLSLELAAARVRTLTPAQILQRLNSSFDVLSGGAADLPARQHTIRSTIQWSVRLLDERARAALTMLSVFGGPFTHDAAAAVLEGTEDAEDAIRALVDASLVQQRERREVRVFTLLAVVRAYAVELGGDSDVARERWISYYLDFGRDAGLGLTGHDEMEWLARTEAESENVVLVLRTLIAAGRFAEAARLAWSLYLFLWVAGGLGTQHDLMTEMLRTAERESVELDPWTEAVALYYANAIAFWQRPDDDVAPGLARSAALFDSTGDLHGAGLARVSLALALLAHPAGPDLSGARRALDEALAEFSRGHDSWGQAMALVSIGRVDLMLGAVDRAAARFERSLAVASSDEEMLGITIALYHRGWARLLLGRTQEAADDFSEALDMSLILGHDEGVAYGLEGCSAVAATREDAEDAGVLLGAALSVRRRLGMVNTGGFTPYGTAIDALRANGSARDVDAGIALGRTLSPREALRAVG